MAEKLLELCIGEASSIWNLHKNMQKLKKKLESLKSREADVRTTLQEAELFLGKKRKAEVETWLMNVDEKRRQVQNLDQKVQETKAYDVYGCWRLAEPVTKMIEDIDTLVDQGSFPEGHTISTSRKNVALVTSQGKGLAFEYNLKKNLSLMMDRDEVFSLGIHGMGGVGKTTLAMHVHDKMLQEPKYSGHVYWATVSQEFDYHKLQNEIAQSLQLNLSIETDEKRRAALLFQRLNKIEKFVLILDDVWKPISLEKIGIPTRTDGCKLLITSRSIDVCNAIGCQKIIQVETLSEAEAWKLFREKLLIGHIQLLEPEVEELAREVARRCGGLPLGIITMAGTMRGVTDIHEWKDVLEEMKASSSMGLENMTNDVLPILLCSYNRLRNTKLQRCFLYCCLYPEDYKIRRDKLIRRFILEELMDRRTSRQAYYDQGHSILNQLEKVCLLEGIEYPWGEKRVKMHDLVRGMGLWITRETYMVKSGLKLERIPLWQDWTKDLSKVSLMKNKIRQILSDDDASKSFPNLSTLLLNGNVLLSSIPDSLFLHMPNLQILDLSETGIKKLPDSVLVLENLKSLLLSWCSNLKHLPSLEKLKALRELDLSIINNIEEAIIGANNLTNLESLDLSGVRQNVVPIGTLCWLPRLQRLILYRESIALEEEVAEGFPRLEEFGGAFRNMCDLNRFMKLDQHCHGKLHTYDVYVGCQFQKASPIEYRQRRLTFENCSMKEICSQDNIMLPRDIRTLCIRYCEQIECIVRLSYDPLRVEDIQRTLGEVILPTLGKVEKLDLYKLPEFEGMIKWESPLSSMSTIHNPPLPAGTFSCLKELRIWWCERIKVVIPTRNMLDCMKNLEILDVGNCKKIEEIVGEKRVEEDPSQHYNNLDHEHRISLPKLTELHLVELQELKRICSQTMICDSIQRIGIWNCDKLKNVPIPLDALSKMKVTLFSDEKGSEWTESLQWAGAYPSFLKK